MPTIQTQLQDTVEFSPDEDFEQFLRRIPAKSAVYLMADAADQPIQLLYVRNLRNSLKRRLGGNETPSPTRQVNYRDLVRRIRWRRVDSAFEADWIYYEAARELFPKSYKGMVGFRPAWFIHVDPDAIFPRFTKCIDLTARGGMFLGPVEDKHTAARLIELLEDAFDLCRFHNILLEAPRGKPCAYKEMGKCPAPCDGSITMGQYRLMIEWSLRVLMQPAPFIEEHTLRMQQAAGELRFESAAKIKAFIGRLLELGKGAFRHVRPLSGFRYVCLQRGAGEKTAKVFLITPGQIEEVFGLIAEPAHLLEWLAEVTADFEKLNTGDELPLSEFGTDRIGVVTRHLFMAKHTAGVFLRSDGMDNRKLLKAFCDVQKQKVKEVGEEEGLVKELQAL